MQQSTTITSTQVLGIPISNLDYQGVIGQVAGWIERREHKYICVCPVHSLIDARRSTGHREALLNADINTADGMPVVWAQKMLGYRGGSRVYGPTLMLHTLKRAQESGWRVAFYGGHPDRLPRLIERLENKFPRLQIVESISPPFRELTEQEDEQYTSRLQAAKPDLIWVGLGAPKQEIWMAEHSPKIPSVMVGVGAAFDFHAGAVRQAPPALQRIGMEWAFRLYCEPRRLFKRYATANPMYVVLLTGQMANRLLLRKNYQKHR